MATVPKFQTCTRCGDRVPTQFALRGDEIEFPGVHICPQGHMFVTNPDPRPGEETLDTDTVERAD